MAIYRRASRWVLGEQGDVVAEREARVLIVANAMLITGTAVLSPLIADLATQFGVSEARAGLLIIAYSGALVVAIPVAGVAADRLGRKTVVVPGIAVFGLAGAAIALVDSFALGVALRLVQAVGAGFASPIIVALLGDLYSGDREATAQAARVALDSVVSMTAPLVAGILFVVSWRYPFAVYLLGVPTAVWLWVALPDRDSPTAGRSLRVYLHEMAVFASNPVMAALLASLFVRMVLMYGLYTYISVLATTEAGLAVVAIGGILSLRSLSKLLSSSQAGRLATAFDPVLVALLGFGLAGVGLLLMGGLPTATVLLVGAAIYGFGDGLLSPAQKSLVNQLSPPAYRGGSMSAAYTFQNLGKTVGPIGLGVVLGVAGPAPAFVLLGIVGGGLGVLLLFLVWWWRGH